jgi:hypothetical protein
MHQSSQVQRSNRADHRRASLLCAAATVIVLASPVAAQAQSFDPSTRLDTREGRERDIERASRDRAAKARTAGVEEKSWAVEFSGAGAFTSNADQARDDGIEASYFTPGLKYSIKQTVGDWTVSAYAKADVDYFTADGEDLEEGRLDGRVSFTRDVGGERTLGLRYRASAGFDRSFGDHYYTVHRISADLSGSVGKFGYYVGLEQHLSDIDELRRTRVMAIGDYSWETSIPDTTLTLEEALIFSDFQGGANKGRNDLLSQTTLSVERTFDSGWTLGFGASLTHDFSNRDERRFTSIEVGPTFSFAF